MNLFHGSTSKVEKPQLLQNQRLLDFGRGFYTTGNREKAERWATIKAERMKGVNAIVNEYSIEDSIWNSDEFKIKKFTEANEEWLDFVYMNRVEYKEPSFDIILGPVANDTLYATLSLYETGVLSKEETINRLKVNKLYDQVSFHSEKALVLLKFVECYTL